MRPAKVVIYGEIGLDNIISVSQPLDHERDAVVCADEYTLGGYGCNVAVLLALWGIPVRLSGYAVGSDPYGRMVLDLLGRYPGLDCSFIETRADVKTAFCRIIADPSGNRTILTFNLHAPSQHPTPLTEALIAGASHLVLDGLSRRAAFLPAAEMAKKAGLVVINSDINSLTNPINPFVDVFCNSASLLRNKNGVTDAPAFARQLHQVHGAAIITTDGPRAIHVVAPDGGEVWVLPPRISPERIVDTTGAGDALKAGLTYGLLNAWPLEKCVRYGAAAGALIIQAMGSVTREPDTEEIIALMEQTQVTTQQPHG